MGSDADPAQVPDLLKEAVAVMIAQIRDSANGSPIFTIGWSRGITPTMSASGSPRSPALSLRPLISASVNDAAQFRSGRHFAAWIGLVPRDFSTQCARPTKLAYLSRARSVLHDLALTLATRKTKGWLFCSRDVPTDARGLRKSDLWKATFSHAQLFYADLPLRYSRCSDCWRHAHPHRARESASRRKSSRRISAQPLRL